MARLTKKQVNEYLTMFKVLHDCNIELYQAKNKQYALRIKGKNGQIIAATETYKTKDSAEYSAARLIVLGLNAKYKDLTIKNK